MTDRLEEIKSKIAPGDTDTDWLVAEVERLRGKSRHTGDAFSTDEIARYRASYPLLVNELSHARNQLAPLIGDVPGFVPFSEIVARIVYELTELRETVANPRPDAHKASNRLDWVHNELSALVDAQRFLSLEETIDYLKEELTGLRASMAEPLSNNDRVSGILENVSGKVYDKQARTDINWLVQEVGRLRGFIKRVNRKLGNAVWVAPDKREDTNCLVDTAVRHLKAGGSELSEIHDTLAEALGFERAPTTEEDPDCPCPGDYITGEHTASTLASAAAHRIKDDTTTINQLGRSVDHAVAQITEMEHDMAEIRDRRSSHPSAAYLELEQLRAYTECTCAYQAHLNEIWPSPECEMHGVEACDAINRGQLALNELALLRSILLGKPQQDGS